MQTPAVPDELAFSTTLRTRWSDEDNHGVVNNAVYSTLLEEARLAYFRHLELMDGERFPFVLAQSNVRFVRPGKGGVPVRVDLGTTRLGNRSFEQGYRIVGLDEANGREEVWCEAEALLVMVDGDGKSRAIDDAFRAAVEGFERA